jgi:hypothetical protein
LTPDAVILDELYINNKRISWLDSKNYYGSTTSSFKRKLEKQIIKYSDSIGYGCVIFKLGMNKNIVENFKTTLFIDSGPLETTTNIIVD